MKEFAKELTGKTVLIRTYSAGVHFGILEKVDFQDGSYPVKLTDSQRIYNWTGACSLSQIAKDGLHKEGSKISVKVPSIFLSAIEIIEMTEKSVTAMRGYKIWKS